MKTFLLRLLRIAKLWPEVFQVVGILAGWGSLTFGLASLLVWQIWPISLGLFILSMVGWGHMRMLFGKGLYTLSRTRTGKDVKRV